MVFAENENQGQPPFEPTQSAAVPTAPSRLSWVHLFRELQSIPSDRRSDYINKIFAEHGREWAMAQRTHLLANFLKNEDGSYSGAVWASPSEGRPPHGDDPGEPDYRFNWTRDSAIAVDAVATLYDHPDTTVEQKREYAAVLRGYADFTRKVQELPIAHEWIKFDHNGASYFVAPGTPGAIPARYGEAKHRVELVDGPHGKKVWVPKPFDEPWGRPQNDGPALRATTMSNIVRILRREEERKKGAGEKIEDTERHAIGKAMHAMKQDLSFVQYRWKDPSYDLWEEVAGEHFFTRVVQSEALQKGADLLKELGEPGHETFRDAHREIERGLGDFWDPHQNHLIATRNIKGGMRKDTDIDMAIVMAALRRKRGYLSASDPRVLATAMRLHDVFSNDPKFEMNRIPGMPAIAVGRYPVDPWTGERRLQNPDGSPISAGHPWVITTLAMGQLFYQAAVEFKDAGRIEINDLNRRFFELVMKGDPLPAGSKVVITKAGKPELFADILSHLEDTGAKFGARIIASGIKATEATTEQFKGDPNHPVKGVGAQHLTWNCAAFVAGLAKSYRQLKGTLLPVRR